MAYNELMGRQVMRTHVMVAKAAITMRRGASAPLPQGEAPIVEPLAVPTPTDDKLFQVCHKYGRALVLPLLAWLRLVTGPAVCSEPKWISYVQLYTAFVASTGIRPPRLRTTTRQWYSVADNAVLLLREVPLSKRATWFQLQMREIVAAAGGTLVSRQLRPSSEMLQIRLSSLFTRLSSEAFAMAESRLYQALGSACCRHDSRWKVLVL